jgi:cytoskeletal protein RodZ
MKDKRFDLEGELRAGRSRPRDEFASALADEVRGASKQARQSRYGLWVAMTGLIVVAIASFGGISYAATNNAAEAQYATPTIPIETTSTTTETVTTDAVTPPESTTTESTPESTPPASTTTTTTKTPTTPAETPAANAAFSPPKAVVKKAAVKKKPAYVKPKVVKHHVQTTGQTKSNVAPKVSSGQLPFTGLALWIPLAAGFVLIALGLTLRTKARRRNSPAH